MHLLLSGEAGSDIGGMGRALDGTPHFDPGPLAHIIDSIIEETLGYSLLATGLVTAMSRGELSKLAKATPRHRVLPGVRRPAGYAGDFLQAYALGTAAINVEQIESDTVVAIIFRDCDGTRSDSSRRWAEIVQATEGGFKAASFFRGVAMIAKPKQEAWFLCAVKDNAYVNCLDLEGASGNDNSPSSLKGKLERAIGRFGDKEALIEIVESGRLDWRRLDMPSFNHFVQALRSALQDA